MQSRFDSWLEAITNTAVGFIISLIVLWLVAWAFHLRTSPAENILITLIFTIASILRQYILRRLFNGRSIGAVIVAKLEKVNGRRQQERAEGP